MKTRSTAILPVLAASLFTLPLASDAATFVTVGVYDEPGQTNAVDTNASGNALASPLPNDVAGFSAAVGAAFGVGQGGVVNFDLPNNLDSNLTDSTGIAATYAGGTKTLNFSTITNIGGNTSFNYTTFSSIRPISGSRGALPNASGVVAFRLAISGDEAVQTLAFTLLSRDGLTQDVRVEFLINGDNDTPIAPDTENIATGQGVDDTFFSYTAESGSAITGVRVNYLGTATDRRLAIDDLGFITVPEPTTAMMLLGGAGMLGLLRRRAR